MVDGRDRTADQVDPAVRARALEMIRHTFELPEWDGERQPLVPEAIYRLDEIDVPTMLVLGDYDQLDIYTIAGLLRAGISDTEQVVILGAAHLPNMERPAEFIQIVLEFLDTV